MADVLIKGMDMPKTCYECKFALARFDPLPTRKYKRHDFECVLTEKTLTSTKRNRACPLVPVPPHGRLIDADELLNDVRKNSESYFADDFAHEWVDRQHTVIEASEDGEQDGKL